MKTITLPLNRYLQQVLREDHHVTIDKETADILYYLTKGDCSVHIQYHDEFERQLEHPRLWQYKHWKADSDYQATIKERSRREREARFILDENVLRLTKAIMRVTGVDAEMARSLAYRKLKQENCSQVVKEFYKVNLITKIEDFRGR